MTVKRFEVTFNDSDFHLKDNETGEELKLVDEKVCYDYIADRWNTLHEENMKIKSFLLQKIDELNNDYERGVRAGMPTSAIISELDLFEGICRMMGWIE